MERVEFAAEMYFGHKRQADMNVGLLNESLKVARKRINGVVKPKTGILNEKLSSYLKELEKT